MFLNPTQQLYGNLKANLRTMWGQDHGYQPALTYPEEMAGLQILPSLLKRPSGLEQFSVWIVIKECLIRFKGKTH